MTMGLPETLPFSGNWDDYLDTVYTVYLETIVNYDLRFNNLPVKPRFTPVTKGKHFGFWHIIQEGNVEDDRTRDFRRTERLRWIKWVIENYKTSAAISGWIETRDNVNEVVLWVEHEQYVVVLSERRGYWVLKTAYLADRPKKIKQLQKSRAKLAMP